MTRNAYQARKGGKTSYNSTLGPANYQAAGRPTLTFPDVRTIPDLGAVHLHCTGGYRAEPVSIAGNTVTFRMRAPTATFTASGALAVHTHALHLDNADVADGMPERINAGANLLGCNTGADIAVAGVPDATGDGGIVVVSAGTPAGTVTLANPEVTNGTDVSAFTVYGQAFGY